MFQNVLQSWWEDSGEESNACQNNGDRNGPRTRVGIYQKVVALREMQRLIDSGKKSGVEKAVMDTFPHIFAGKNGRKSGMLGRWKTQAESQGWLSIPWEKMSDRDKRDMKELPDWVRIPLGMAPRSIERFKSGRNVPPCVMKKIVEMIERVTTGGEHSQLTSGKVDTKSIKREAEELLRVYQDTQEAFAKEMGIEVKSCKEGLSDRWVCRVLQAYGWKPRTPNTYGAYLDYEDQRMIRSRQLFKFQRDLFGTRLDLCLNFDQLWKSSWEQPKKLWHRTFGSDCPAHHLRGKRDQVLQHLSMLQNGEDRKWEVKRRRITG